MKITISALLLLLCFAGQVFPATGSSVMEVSYLIDSGLHKNFALISSKSASLTEVERLMIYSNESKSPWGIFAGNLLIGLGLGSYIGGDALGGTVQLVGELTGIVLAQGPESDRTVYGVLIFIASRVFAVIRPFPYTRRYNRTLKAALSGKDLTLEFAPGLESRSAGLTGQELFYSCGASLRF